ncbi:Arylsulfatase precursor [Planctomycetes bacterium CA13]|uniref:Arylsulfatase n=1 Tax=Novipirellula herctigrandis TaxID=2527986 RepID=A0A5C5Z288_9BACT|nr:Arylsulfatase precursor [Planctomycetes bacterium CA13]
MNRIPLMAILCLALPPLLGLRSATQAEQPPNIVIVLADDLGYSDVGFNGCKDIPTPHIDSIAENGVRFTNGYVSFSVCGPSRAGLMTGRYQGRFGFRVNPSIDPTDPTIGLPQDEKNLAETLGTVGYTSGVLGKWHLGSHPTQHPLKRGFDEFYGFLSGGHDYFPEKLTLNDLSEVRQKWQWYRTKIMRNYTRETTDEYLTDELSNEAVAFVERHREKPFFLYLSYNAPHTPLQATEKYLDRFAGIANKKRKTYAAMVSAVDDGVGRLLQTLREQQLEQNTLVFFLSDNGGPETSNASNNGPLRDGKGSFYEGGVRVPFAVQWPGTLPQGIDYDSPVISLDIFATAVSLAGASTSPDRPLDGVNLIPFLTGKDPSSPHTAFFWNNVRHETFAMRSGDSKLVKEAKSELLEMYDLDKDLGEENDQASLYPEQQQALAQAFDEWKRQLLPAGFPGLDHVWWK